MLKPNLQIRVQQSLTLTPQLQQTIKLLQYSTLELQQQIQQMLEANPMLDLEEPGYEPELDERITAEAAPRNDEKESTESYEQPTQDIPEELPLDTSWDAIYEGLPSRGGDGGEENDADYWQNTTTSVESLQDHLAEQIRLSPLTELDQAIAQTIIFNLDNNGYLVSPLEELLDEFAGSDPEVTLDDLRAVQSYVMQLDPVGCGAQSLQECLTAQLQGAAADPAIKQVARQLVSRHLEQLAKSTREALAHATHSTPEQVREALDLIRSLNPKPGADIGVAVAEYVIPDVYVGLRNGRWVASLNPDLGPRLRVHPFYSSLIRRGNGSMENRYLREQMQEARWFIKSIQSRNETILRVAEVIVDKQQAFFNLGEEAMRPMVLRDVAEELGMHESTISRVTTQKFMQTPRGVYEFKYFFSSQLATDDGNSASATAIRALIRNLISDENPKRPLSDSQIAAILAKEKGIQVARRTVAKYREAMQIPSSSDRKRIA